MKFKSIPQEKDKQYWIYACLQSHPSIHRRTR